MIGVLKSHLEPNNWHTRFMAIYTQVLNLGNTRLDDGRRILKSRL
jgi:hypothetical protein